MTKDEALRLALEALEDIGDEWGFTSQRTVPKRKEAITAIKAALEAKDEPVGKFAKFTDNIWREVTDGSAGMSLYTTPPQRTWVGLTDEEVWEAYMESPVELDCSTDELYALSRTVEAKLKDKNVQR